MDVKQIKAAINKLTSDEVVSLYQSLAKHPAVKLRSRGGAVVQGFSNDSPFELLLSHAIHKALDSEGLVVSERMIRNSKAFKDASRDRIPDLQRWLDRSAPGTDKTARFHILVFGLRLLYKRLQSFGVATTATNLLNNLDKLQSEVEKQFPGYARNKALAMIVGVQRDGKR